MKEYRRSMAAAVRWAILAMVGVGFFWLVWKAITGSVPKTDSVFGTPLPVPYSRGWDIIFAPLTILICWPIVLNLFELGNLWDAQIKNWGAALAVSTFTFLGVGVFYGLVTGLGIGLVCGLVLASIAFIIVNLLTSLIFGLKPGLIPSLRKESWRTFFNWLAAKDVE